MSASSWKELIAMSKVDGAALANSVAETSILPAASKKTLLANFYDNLGKKLILRAAGRASTVVTTPGTLTFRVKHNAVNVFASQAIPLNIVAQVNATWELYLELDLRAEGAAANLMGIGFWASRALVGAPAVAAGGIGQVFLPDTAPVVGANFDSTIDQVIDLTAQWSIANAANSIQLHQFSLFSGN